MDKETKEAGSKLLISVLTIIATTLSANGYVDYRGAERTQAVHDEVNSVSSQNREILLGLSELLDKKLEQTSRNSEANVTLNKSILQGTSQNKDLNQEILHRLEALEQKIK